MTADGRHHLHRVLAAHVDHGDARQGGPVGHAQGYIAVLAGLFGGRARTLRVRVGAESGEDIAAVEEVTNRLGSTEQAVHAEFFLAAVRALGDRRVLLDEAHKGGQGDIR